MSKTLHLNVQLLNLAVSFSTIIKSANFILCKKRKIHKLTLSIAERHHKRALRLYRYRNFVTSDESWFYLDGNEMFVI